MLGLIGWTLVVVYGIAGIEVASRVLDHCREVTTR